MVCALFTYCRYANDIMLSVIVLLCYSECCYADFYCAECRYVKCCYAVCAIKQGFVTQIEVRLSVIMLGVVAPYQSDLGTIR
jgi:hypothetical protein